MSADRIASIQASERRDGAVTSTGLLPDPEPRTRHYTIISVDDHLI